MYKIIDGVLSPEHIQKLISIVEGADFSEGGKTAFGQARAVKNNLQLLPDEPVGGEASKIVTQALLGCSEFVDFALPDKVQAPRISRYDAGMAYGVHTDAAFMGQPNAIRTDISVTIAINAADQYEGGELIIQGSWGNMEVKLKAGSAFVYPASTLHQVAEVTKGTRLVALTWVKSWVRDPAQREILQDVEMLRSALTVLGADKEINVTATKIRENLRRQWFGN